MKKLKFITACCVAFISFTQLHSQCTTVLFSDDFEGSTSIDPAWTLMGGYTRTILTSGSPEGTNHLQQDGNSAHYSGMIGYFTTSTPTYASWWVKSPAAAGNCGYVVMGDAGTTGNNGIIFEYFTSVGTLRFYNNTVNFEMPILYNTWYHVEMNNINFTTHTYDLWVNGILVQANYAFRSFGSVDVNQIHLYNYDASTSGSYDDIVVQIGSDTTDPLISAPANIITYTDPGQCNNSTLTLGSPITSDLCGIASTVNDAPSIFPIGITNVTWTTTDNSGNTATATQTVEVSDTTDPNLTAPSDITFNVNNTGCTGTTILASPVFSDNCSASVSNDAPSVFPIGTTLVTWTATDLSGNTTVQTQNVTVTNNINISSSSNNISCFGAGDGNIDIAPSGGVGAYSYNWNSGSFTTEDLVNVAAGNYIGIVTDSIGCSDTVSISLSEPSEINTTALSNNISCFGANDGNINITPSGGVGPYSYSWNSGTFTSEDLTNVIAGNYTGIITDSIGCTDTISISLSEPSAINVNVNLTGVTLTSQQTSATYQWIDCNNGNAIIPGQTNQSFTATVNGSYAVIVTVGVCSDTSACTSINTFSIEDYGSGFVRIYPNPSNGVVNINTTEAIEDAILKITDLAGKVVYMQIHLNGTAFSIDISNYADGIYLLQLQQGSKINTTKLVKN